VLNRFYAICNCGAMQAQQHGTPMLISSGYVCLVDTDLCAACGVCAGVCQFEAIKVEAIAMVDTKACLGCGVCVEPLPAGCNGAGAG